MYYMYVCTFLPYTSSQDGESQHDTESDSQSIVLENPEGVAANISTASVDDGKGQFTHVLQKDGYQVFKAMVKLSEKGILDSSDPRCVCVCVQGFIWGQIFGGEPTHLFICTYVYTHMRGAAWCSASMMLCIQ